jgi:glucosamine-6-phosphate deaminase
MAAHAPSLPLVVGSPTDAARRVASEVAALIRARAREGRAVVLGLATGRTPLGIYEELARLHRDEGLSFANVVTFNLDEYLGLAPDHPCSFRRYMREKLFERVGIADASAWLPASDVAPSQIEAHCREYEERITSAGGIDLQILGIGRNGHIGFNEPGSRRDSRTRSVVLAEETREDAARAFGGLQHVPERAITMGVATILAARKLRVLAFGAHKREIVRRVVSAPIDPALPATFLREHGDVVLYTDVPAD